MPNNCDTLIIGAGAAGLMAAIQCAQRGQSVTLLEKMDRPGRKLLRHLRPQCHRLLAGVGDKFRHGYPTSYAFL